MKFPAKLTSTTSRGGLAVLVLLGMIAIWWFLQADETLNVPLGVEQAAIISYGGPALAVKPFKWGVAVNVRIAQASAQDGLTIYDVRYLVNRAGTFDLRDYLLADNGTPLDGLPSFKFTGDAKLSKLLDNRIKETEEVGVQVSGYYYAKLGVVGVLWILWLLGLIFLGRPRRPVAPVLKPLPTVAELLQAFLAKLAAGTLTAADKAQMEMLLLRRWRTERHLEQATMRDCWAALSADALTREPLRQLEAWLHQPTTTIGDDAIVALVEPHARP